MGVEKKGRRRYRCAGLSDGDREESFVFPVESLCPSRPSEWLDTLVCLDSSAFAAPLYVLLPSFSDSELSLGDPFPSISST